MRAVFGNAFSEVTARAGVPYGYTLTIWSAGALCVRRFGLPNIGEVFLFVAGGSLGYWLASLCAQKISAPRTVEPVERIPPLWQNVVVLAALAATYSLDLAVPGAYPNFLVVPFLATFLSICLA